MSKSKQAVSIISLTPETARRLLADNSHNRPLRMRRVKQLAKSIIDGRWKFNGASIVRETTGRLADGQHRCHAVIQAKKAVRTVFVDGVKPSAFDTIDQGFKRTGADIFNLCGVAHAGVVAASMSIIYQHNKGIVIGTSGAGYLPDMDERIDLFDSMPGYENLVQEVCQLRDAITGVMPQSKLVGLYYLFSKKGVATARCFLNALASTDTDALNPAGVVRKQLLKIDANKDFRLGAQAHCAYIKLAWNAFAAGRKITTISLPSPATLDIPIDSVTSRYWVERF